MASNSPDSPSKKRKQFSNSAHLKRDQPLFTSRRMAPMLQQPPDFLTDSLNTSHIPSPSPTQSPTHESARARPRQALDRKSLSAAFRATAVSVDENQRPGSTSLPIGKNRNQERKPRPTQPSNRGTPKSAIKKPQSPTRPRTPSPPRGRQLPIESPANSESSPGRGYAEAYQRIVEEENLAQEDSIDDIDIDDFDPSLADQSRTLDIANLQRLHETTSPPPLRASRRSSPQANLNRMQEDDIENKENVPDERSLEGKETHEEDATLSSLDSGSSQYARDLQRLNGALRSGPKAFSKARLGERVGLTVQNLRRQNGSNESLQSTQSAGSFSQRGSDPSINVPKAWGRKARPEKDWLSRINSRSGRLTGDTPKRHLSGEDIFAHGQSRNEGREDIDEWIAAASEVPLPNSEHGSSMVTSSSKSTPVAATRSPSSLDRRRKEEIGDELNTRSLQKSESPPTSRKSILNSIHGREIEKLEKQAVTTHRLGALRERSSDGYLQKSSPHRSSRESLHSNSADSQGSLHRRPKSDRLDRISRISEPDLEPDTETAGVDADDTGEIIPDTPVVIYKTKSKNLIGFDESSVRNIQDSRRAARRPVHERKDSQDILKRLARASSESPSPDKESSFTRENAQETPQVPKSTKDLKTPVVTGAWVDLTTSETPQASGSDTGLTSANLKTPFVTGAWIDTPLPTGARGPLMVTPLEDGDDQQLGTSRPSSAGVVKQLSPNAEKTRPKIQPESPLKYTGPPLPKSALQNILDRAKGDEVPLIRTTSDSEEDPTLHLGDSTIQSLEDLIANDTDLSTNLAGNPPSQERSSAGSDPSSSSTSTTADDLMAKKPVDPQSYNNILSRLTNLGPSIRDSKKQLASLERAVAKAPAKPKTQSLTDQVECHEAGELHDFIWPCQQCGCPGRMEPDFDSMISLRANLTSINIHIPFPKLWYWRQGHRRPRLTWLGVITLIAWSYVIAEAWAR